VDWPPTPKKVFGQGEGDGGPLQQMLLEQAEENEPMGVTLD